MTPFTQDRFVQNFESGKTQLAWAWIPSDLQTPVSAYLKLCGQEAHAFLLESVEGGNVLGRYSIIGHKPDLLWVCEDQKIEIAGHDGEWKQDQRDAVSSLKSVLHDCHIDEYPEDLPPMAVSGLFGYLGYDMVRLIEDIPNENPDQFEIPDSVLMRPTVLAIFDNVKQMACIVAPVYEHAKNSALNAEEAYAQAKARVDEAVKELQKPLDHSLTNSSSALSTPLEVSSNMEKDEFKAVVEKVKQYTYDGDIFQCVPSQRFSVNFDLPSFDFYRTLRRVNPSPFMFHLAFKNFQIVGASPEVLVRVRDDEITIRAIAGTRKRGANAEEDKALAEDLLADEKERAEHLMLVDLGRNDVGRVSEFGSVKVTEFFTVEYYSHVMHIVSNIVGKLKNSLDIVDALFAGFPAGTLTGAPKVRAMEIIDEVEVNKRGIYGGGIGYLSGNGVLDTCIAIRTALIKDGKLYAQAGGGVVADSSPEGEYQETVNKASALIRAAEAAIETASAQD